MTASRGAARPTAPHPGLLILLALIGLLGADGPAPAGAAAALPLDRMPLDAARCCNRSCPAASCSVVCRVADDCASACTRRGAPVCRCRHGRQT